MEIGDYELKIIFFQFYSRLTKKEEQDIALEDITFNSIVD